MKFTEEQYQKIVKGWNDKFTYRESTQAVVEIVNNISHGMLEEALALALPLTREWAHDKFVEKEPEFHFVLKNKKDAGDLTYHLTSNCRGAIILYPFSEEDDDNPKFKESEIKEWGFNPEMFDREEA